MQMIFFPRFRFAFRLAKYISIVKMDDIVGAQSSLCALFSRFSCNFNCIFSRCIAPGPREYLFYPNYSLKSTLRLHHNSLPEPFLILSKFPRDQSEPNLTKTSPTYFKFCFFSFAPTEFTNFLRKRSTCITPHTIRQILLEEFQNNNKK